MADNIEQDEKETPEQATPEATETPVSFSGTIENQWGRKLPKVLTYAAKYTKALVLAAVTPKERLTPEDELKIINDARKASKRQTAMQEALDAAAEVWKKENPDAKDANGKPIPNPFVKPEMKDDPNLQVKSMVLGMVASGLYTEEQATKVARQMLKLPEVE